MSAMGMPPMGMMPEPAAPPMFPSMDSGVIGQMLAQILQMQQQDHAALAAGQQQAFAANPIVQALLSGGGAQGMDVESAAPMPDETMGM